MAFKYRYPNSQLERDSDFLEIKVVEYEPPGFNSDSGEIRLKSSSVSLENNIEKPLGYVFLPIPESIQDSNSVTWGEDSINGIAAKGIGMIKNVVTGNDLVEGIGGAATSMKDVGSSAIGSAVMQDVASTYFASQAVNTLGGNTSLSGLLARSSGVIMNPNKELLFGGVNLRAFSFDFDLTPRDRAESSTIKNIIRLFKVNMNPKKSAKGDKTGLFVQSPNVFQLSYKTGGGDHSYLHRFKPMALANMAVNYTGAGTYATYDDTTPVHMKLSLSFQELNPVYAEDYEDEQGKIGVGY